MILKNRTWVVLTAALIRQSSAFAVEIEPLGKAVAALLGTTKAFRKTLGSGDPATTVFYSKNTAGHPERLVFIQKGIYEPNCTHTWAVGLDPRSAKVTEVRVIEMSCPHAFPAKSASFLSQYAGKGVQDLAQLDSKIIPVAKATGSSKLTTDAVRRSIQSFAQYKGQLE